MNEKKKRNQYKFDKEKYDHIHLQTPKGKRYTQKDGKEFVMLVANNYKKSKWRLIFNSDTCILSHFY